MAAGAAALSEPLDSAGADWLAAGRIRGMDGLRALAILLVVAGHAAVTHRPRLDETAVEFLSNLSIGVDLFFVISGFLITTLLLRERNRTGRIDLRSFYARRALRIFPAYYAYLAVVFAVQSAGAADIPARDWVAAATYTMNFIGRPAWEVGHAWTLSLEEQFYLLWPFALLFGDRRSAARVAVAAISACFVLRWGVLLFRTDLLPIADTSAFTRMDSIVFGGLLALGVADPAVRRRLTAATAPPAAIVGLLLSLIASLWLGDVSGKFQIGVGLTLNAAIISLLLWAVLVRANAGRWAWLESAPLRALGVRSYSLYLYQQLFLHEGGGPLRTFPLNVGAAVAAAWLSYAVVERPLLAARARLRPAGVRRAAGDASNRSPDAAAVG